MCGGYLCRVSVAEGGGFSAFHRRPRIPYELLDELREAAHSRRPKYPEHAAESWLEPDARVDDQEWDRLRRDFAWFLPEYEEMARSSPQQLQRQVESMREGDKKHAGSVEAVLWQMVVHNSYHVGQIAMIRRVMGAWPPRAGGDTW